MIEGKRAAIVAVMSAALFGCDTGPEIVPAKWAQTPSADDMTRAYPDFARMARIPGRVKVSCNTTLDGALERCRVLGEAPEGLHFREALPRLLGQYVVTPQTLDGRPAPGPLTFVIAFDPPPAPAPYQGPAPTAAEVASARRGFELMERFEGRSEQHQASRSVDLDRMTVVADIVDRVYEAEGDNLMRARAIAQVQIQTPAARRDGPSRSSFMISRTEELERVSPEYHAAVGKAATLMRADYCARYSCDARLPAAPAAN